LLLLIAFQNFRSLSYKLICCLPFGLSLTNHLTTVFIGPGFSHCSFPAVWQHPNRYRRLPPVGNQVGVWLVVCVLLSALGLSVYLYLPIRWPAVNHGEAMTWDLFKHFLTGQEAQGALRLNAWYSDFSRYQIVFGKMINELLGQDCWLRCWGCGTRPHPPLSSSGHLCSLASQRLLALSFYVPDPDYSSFLLPSHFIQAIWIALGIYALAILLSSYLPRFSQATTFAFVYCLYFAIPAQLNPAYLPAWISRTNGGVSPGSIHPQPAA